MPRTKSSSATTKRKTARSKSKTAVRDIKPKAKARSKKKAADFTIRGISEDDIPTVEPLVEDYVPEISDMAPEIPEPPDFEVNEVSMDIDYEPARPPTMDVNPISEPEEETKPEFTIGEVDNARDLIKVKFGTFVNLISNRDLEDIFEANVDQNIVMSSNLLTEMASSRDKREERKIPLVFLVGIAIGVVLTYIFFST